MHRLPASPRFSAAANWVHGGRAIALTNRDGAKLLLAAGQCWFLYWGLYWNRRGSFDKQENLLRIVGARRGGGRPRKRAGGVQMSASAIEKRVRGKAGKSVAWRWDRPARCPAGRAARGPCVTAAGRGHEVSIRMATGASPGPRIWMRIMVPIPHWGHSVRFLPMSPHRSPGSPWDGAAGRSEERPAVGGRASTWWHGGNWP